MPSPIPGQRHHHPLTCLPILLAALTTPVTQADDPNTAPAPVYAKIILPTTARQDADHPVVESWISDDLQHRGVEHYRAVTDWVRLPEPGEGGKEVWSAVLDGKRWGCPVVGSIDRNAADGRVTPHLAGWSPILYELKATTLPAETGTRHIAAVEDNIAYVALLIVPPLPQRSEE